jgi:transposase
MPRLVGEIRPGVRQPGGGRYRLSQTDESLERDLEELLEASSRGDPMCPLRWTCKSTRKLAKELQHKGHQVSHMTVDRMLQDMDYSLQANRKMLEGRQHPDRDEQFQFIAPEGPSFPASGSAGGFG